MIKVCDSIMGSGKTQAAISYINEHQDARFIYVAPYLAEVGAGAVRLRPLPCRLWGRVPYGCAKRKSPRRGLFRGLMFCAFSFPLLPCNTV